MLDCVVLQDDEVGDKVWSHSLIQAVVRLRENFCEVVQVAVFRICVKRLTVLEYDMELFTVDQASYIHA